MRGLFDTDGCEVVQRSGKYKYNLLKICTKLKNFAEQINKSYESLGIESYICRKSTGYDVVVRRRNSYNLFFDIIEPKNDKGLIWGRGDSNPNPTV